MEREASREQTEPHWTKIHIWTDFQATIKRLQYTALSSEQWLARRIIRRAQQLLEHGTAVEIYWVQGHMCVEGNEKADEAVKEAIEKAGTRRFLEQLVSLTHIGHPITEQN